MRAHDRGAVGQGSNVFCVTVALAHTGQSVNWRLANPERVSVFGGGLRVDSVGSGQAFADRIFRQLRNAVTVELFHDIAAV